MTIKLITDNGKWCTPYGHEFNTEAELKAFIQGVEYLAGNLQVSSDAISNRLTLWSKNEQGEKLK